MVDLLLFDAEESSHRGKIERLTKIDPSITVDYITKSRQKNIASEKSGSDEKNSSPQNKEKKRKVEKVLDWDVIFNRIYNKESDNYMNKEHKPIFKVCGKRCIFENKIIQTNEPNMDEFKSERFHQAIENERISQFPPEQKMVKIINSGLEIVNFELKILGTDLDRYKLINES